MVMLSGSARNETSTLKPPTSIHSKSRKVNERSSSSSATSPAKVTTPATNEAPTMAVANHPASGSPRRRPATRRTRKPASGSAGTSQTALSTASPAEQADVVGGRPGASPQDGHDDAEADHDLGRGHDQHEEDHDLAPHVVEAAGEGDEGQVDGVEHELDAHEHHQRVAADEHAHAADGEQHGAEDQVPLVVDHGLALLRLAGPAGQHHGTDHGDHQERGRGLEGEQVVREEAAA